MSPRNLLCSQTVVVKFHDETEKLHDVASLSQLGATGAPRHGKSMQIVLMRTIYYCTGACGANHDECVGKERSYDRRNTNIPRPSANAVRTIEIVYREMVASIVATTCHTAYHQGAHDHCDCQTVAAFDQHETQCHASADFDTNCHMILWYERILGAYREVQGKIIEHSYEPSICKILMNI